MLIWIEGGPTDYPLGATRPIVDALIELGEAGYKGRHVIACRRDLAKHLSAMTWLSDRARAYFRRIYGEYTQLGQVLSVTGHIVASLTAVLPNPLAGNWVVPILYFSDETYLEELTVVCENDTDYEIYAKFAGAWMSQNLSSCVVASKSRAGHGGSTVTVLRRLAGDPNPMYLCILDSDRDMPEGAEGSTARGVRSAWINSWRSALYVLACRELENALPLDALDRCLEFHGMQCAELLDYHAVHADISDYVCLKTGESVCRFHRVVSAQTGFQRTRIALAETARRHPAFSSCGGQCAGCGCRVIPALGERFLERFAEWLGRNHSSRTISTLSNWSAEMRSVAELFAKKSMALPRKF